MKKTGRSNLFSIVALIGAGIFVPQAEATAGLNFYEYDYTGSGTGQVWSDRSVQWQRESGGVFWVNSTPPLFYAYFNGASGVDAFTEVNGPIAAMGIHFSSGQRVLTDVNQDGPITLNSPYKQTVFNINVNYLYNGTRNGAAAPGNQHSALATDAGAVASIASDVKLVTDFTFLAPNATPLQLPGTPGVQYFNMSAGTSSLAISGNISEANGAKTIGVVAPTTGTATLKLSGNNSFTGGLYIPNITGSNALSADYRNPVYTSNVRLDLGNNHALGTGTLELSGGGIQLDNTSGSAVTITNTIQLDNAPGGTSGGYALVVKDTENLAFVGTSNLTLTSDFTMTGSRAVRVDDNGGALILSGHISEDSPATPRSFLKNGHGTLIVTDTTNSYTGVTQINGGVLEVSHLANGGVASSIGASASSVPLSSAVGVLATAISTSSTTYLSGAAFTSSTLVPSLLLGNGGTLRYTGTGDSTDRLVGLLPGQFGITGPVTGDSIEASGTGALKFTNPGEVVYLNSPLGARNLILTGTNTDDNTFSLSLTDFENGTNIAHNQLTKSGGGKWIDSGNNSYTGGTTVTAGKLVLTGTNTGVGTTAVNGGTLIVNGDNSGATGAVTVANTATLGGSGIIGGPTTIQSGGTLSPGNSPGQITFLSGLTLNSGSLLAIEFAGTAPGSYDQLDVQGLFTAGGTLQLTIDTGFTPTLGDSFTIFNGPTPGVDAGSFDFVTTNYPDLTWDTSALASTGIITVASVVPEPSTWVLLIMGLAGLAWGARRRAQG